MDMAACILFPFSLRFECFSPVFVTRVRLVLDGAISPLLIGGNQKTSRSRFLVRQLRLYARKPRLEAAEE